MEISYFNALWTDIVWPDSRREMTGTVKCWQKLANDADEEQLILIGIPCRKSGDECPDDGELVKFVENTGKLQ